LIGRKSTLVFATTIISSILGFIGLFFITRYLGTEVYGDIAWILALIAAINAISDLGFSSAHIKKISEGGNIDDCVSTFVMVKVILTTIMVALIAVILAFMIIFGKANYSSEYLGLISLFVLYQVLCDISQIATMTFTARTEAVKSQLIILVDPIVRVPIIIFICLFNGTEFDISFAYAIAGIMVFSLALVLMWRGDYHWTKPSLFRPYLRFTLPLVVATVITTLAYTIDKIFIGAFWTSTDVAYYSSGFALILIISGLGLAISQLTFPTFSHYSSKGRTEDIRRTTVQAERFVAIISFPMVAFLLIYPGQVTSILYGQNWTLAGDSLRWLALATLFNIFNAAATSQILAVNRPDVSFRITVIFFIAFVIGLVILVPREIFGVQLFGLSYVGASLAYLISMLVYFILTRIAVIKLTGTRIERKMGLYAAIFALTTLVLGLLDVWLSIHQWYIVVLMFAAAYAIFWGCLFALKEMKKDDIRYLLDLINVRKMGGYVSDELTGKK
jgi:O-antigen/teichoic acid export membrane protein